MKTWYPRVARACVTKVEKIDFDVFAEPLQLKRHVFRASISQDDDRYRLTPPAQGSSWSAGGVYPYLITFNDGTVASASYPVVQAILVQCGQEEIR